MRTKLWTRNHIAGSTIKLASAVVQLVKELRKPEVWAKIGAGSMGAIAGEALVLGNPISMFGLAIAGSLVVAGISCDAFLAALQAVDGSVFEAFTSKVWKNACAMPEAALTGAIMGGLRAGIKKAAADFKKEGAPRYVWEKHDKCIPTSKKDWDLLLFQKEGLTFEEARKIAESDPAIGRFSYVHKPITLHPSPAWDGVWDSFGIDVWDSLGIDWDNFDYKVSQFYGGTVFRHFKQGDALFFGANEDSLLKHFCHFGKGTVDTYEKYYGMNFLRSL